MKLTTEVRVAPSKVKIAHGEDTWLLGSCFSDEIGARMQRDLFSVEANPAGALYNPASVAALLRRVVACERFSEADFLERSAGVWVTHHLHSCISGATAAEATAAANALISRLHAALPRLRHLVLTFGTTHAFVLRSTAAVVANCHKQPAALFEERTLTVGQIADDISDLIATLRTVAPGLHVVLTVSPIRHKMDLHANAASKGALLLACDEIAACTGADYFPAFEILTDELRDYRFYAADMLHPSPLAVDIVYERFAGAYYTPATAAEATAVAAFSRLSAHRPSPPEAAAHGRRLASEAARLAALYPELSPRLAAHLPAKAQ